MIELFNIYRNIVMIFLFLQFYNHFIDKPWYFSLYMSIQMLVKSLCLKSEYILML